MLPVILMVVVAVMAVAVAAYVALSDSRRRTVVERAMDGGAAWGGGRAAVIAVEGANKAPLSTRLAQFVPRSWVDDSAARAPGLLLVLSAPSGAGKTTLARRFIERHADAAFSVSATTRAARGAERDGVDYHFVSDERFSELVGAGALAEWAEVHGQRYGTLRSTVDEALAAGRIALFDIDVQGGSQIKSVWPHEATTVFVLPPSIDELERRLRGRSTDPEDVIRRRLAAAHAEMAQGLATYDYVVVNDDFDDALRRLEAIAAHERARLGGRRDATAEGLAATCRRGVAQVGRWTA